MFVGGLNDFASDGSAIGYVVQWIPAPTLAWHTNPNFFRSALNGRVYSIAVDNDEIFMGGTFTEINTGDKISYLGQNTKASGWKWAPIAEGTKAFNRGVQTLLIVPSILGITPTP